MSEAKQLAEAVLASLDAQKGWTAESTIEEMQKMIGDIHVACAKVYFLAIRVSKE